MNEVSRTNVIIVLFKYSVVAKVMEKKLTEMSLNVTIVVNDLSKIEEWKKDKPFFMIYLSDDMADNRVFLDKLSQMSDIIVKSGSKMMLIGEKSYHNELIQKLPVLKDYLWLDRPIDVNTLGQTVMKEINSGSHNIEKKKILIVDDDPSYAKLVMEWIKEYYNVRVATAGMQAVSYLKRNKVDLVLLDYKMPEVDGPQVFRMLKSESDLENIPVIVLTGLDTPEGVAELMELNPDGYIIKSTTRENLLKLLAGQFA